MLNKKCCLFELIEIKKKGNESYGIFYKRTNRTS